jgi:hypothetical protein
MEMKELDQSGDYTEMIETGLKFFGAALKVAGDAFPGIGVLGCVLKGLADAAAAAKYNKELAQVLQIKADRVSDAIKGLAADLLQVCVRVRVFACLTRKTENERELVGARGLGCMRTMHTYTHTHTHLHTHTHCCRRRKTENEKRIVRVC